MTVKGFSHVKPGDTEYLGDGLRDFFVYRDLGIAGATEGRVIAQHTRAARKSDGIGTGFHFHNVEFHIVIVTKGWAKFMYDGVETLVDTGDVVHQPSGIVHTLFDYSDDLEYIEIVGPANFGTVEVKKPDYAAKGT
jgi:mannose-6-phosphate isomerase-like protein (cupin superfamily)